MKSLLAFGIMPVAMVAGFASAQEVEGSAEALANDAAIYADLYGVSQAEAERRIQIMVLAQDEVLAEDRAEGDDVIASYFDHSGEFSYVIETKKGKKPKKLKKVRGIEGEITFPIEYKESNKVARKVMRRLLREKNNPIDAVVPFAVGVAYKDREGLLLIQVPDEEAPSDLSAEKASLEKTFKVPVRFERIPTADIEIAMPGGRHTYTNDMMAGRYKHYCSTAFAAYNPSGQIGMLTAGHCDNPFYWSETGTSGFTRLNVVNKYTASGDWAFLTGVPIDRRFQANIGEYRYPTGRRTQGSTYAAGYDIYDNYHATGTFVCWFGGESGSTYGQQCGEVTATYARPKATCGSGTAESPYVPCEYNSIRVEPKAGQSYIYAGQGDSGSPVFAWNTAFGIVGTSAHYFGSAQSISITYTSIDDIYSWDYRLAY